VTDSPNWYNQRVTSLPYRFLSSMQGSLGIGANLNNWSAKDLAVAKEMIAAYKSVREVVQQGSLYRLVSPRDKSEMSATESVAEDRVYSRRVCVPALPTDAISGATCFPAGSGSECHLQNAANLRASS